MDNQNLDVMAMITDNIFLIVIVIILLIYIFYRSTCESKVEGYRDSRSLLRPGTGPIGFSIPSSNLDKSLQGTFHLTQYEVDQAFGTEYANVKLLTERVADIIADYTLRVVVGPCMNAENLRGIDARLDCIKGYKHYYTDILKYPIIDMFAKMDEYEIDPFKKGILKNRDQQYEAMVGLIQAYAKSLDESLKVMATKYKEIGFIPEEFKSNLSFVLSQWFLFRMTQIFRNPDLKWSTLGKSKDDGSSIVSSSDFDTAPSGLPKDTIGVTPMETGSYSVDCADLTSDKIGITVSGRRLRCGPLDTGLKNGQNQFYINS